MSSDGEPGPTASNPGRPRGAAPPPSETQPAATGGTPPPAPSTPAAASPGPPASAGPAEAVPAPAFTPLPTAVTTPAGAAPPPALPAFERPDVNLVRAARRVSSGSPVAAGITGALLAMAVVAAGSLLVGLLSWAAHTQGGCNAAGVVSGRGGCADPGANGLLTNWTAVLWQAHGAGENIGLSNGPTLSVRLPLGLGMLLVASALALGGAFSVRLVRPQRPRDLFLRAAVIAVAYTALACSLGAAVTARGEGVAVGPDFGLLVIWALLLGFSGGLFGIARRLFGSAVPRLPALALLGRLGRLGSPLSAALTGVWVAIALGALLGLVAILTHTTDAANAVRAVVTDGTTKPWPDSALGTLAAVVLVGLALPTLGAWVLAYALIIPTVTVATAQSSQDFGLLAGSHDAWLWIVVMLPLAATLLTGYAAARLERSGSVEAAVGEGAFAGLVWGLLTFLLLTLLDGGGSVGATSFLMGPGLQYAFGALLLWGVVGGALGGYLSLLLLTRRVRLPLLRRYDVAVVGPPVVPARRPLCPACGASARHGDLYCSHCGAPLTVAAAAPATTTPPAPA